MAEKVLTKNQVMEIWAADQRILGLASRWWGAVLNGDQHEARMLRMKSDAIKREIREAYDVIID